MSNEEQSPVVWSPSEDTLANSRMGQFKAWLEQQGFGPFADYHALHKWSVDELETFWQKVWDYCGLVCDTPAEKVLGKRQMPGADSSTRSIRCHPAPHPVRSARSLPA